MGFGGATPEGDGAVTDSNDERTTTADAEQLGYARALGELEQILAELESSDVDVDKLADRVARATTLIAVCRERIGSARMRIDEVIADLDAAAATAAEP